MPHLKMMQRWDLAVFFSFNPLSLVIRFPSSSIPAEAFGTATQLNTQEPAMSTFQKLRKEERETRKNLIVNAAMDLFSQKDFH